MGLFSMQCDLCVTHAFSQDVSWYVVRGKPMNKNYQIISFDFFIGSMAIRYLQRNVLFHPLLVVAAFTCFVLVWLFSAIYSTGIL